MPLHIVIACAAVLEYEGTDKKDFSAQRDFSDRAFLQKSVRRKNYDGRKCKNEKEEHRGNGERPRHENWEGGRFSPKGEE